MRWIIPLLILVMLPFTHAETYEFPEWEISEDGTIIIDGTEWEVVDYTSDDGYVRRIIREKDSDDEIVYLDDEEFIDAVEQYNEDYEQNTEAAERSEGEVITEAEGLPLADFFENNMQFLMDIPVEGTFANVYQYDEGEISAIYYGWYNPLTINSLVPAITPQQAVTIAAAAGGGAGGAGGGGGIPRLMIIPTDETDENGNRLFKLAYVSEDEGGKKIYVDAQTGEIIDRDKEPEIPKDTEYMMKGLIAILVLLLIGIIIIFSLRKKKK